VEQFFCSLYYEFRVLSIPALVYVMKHFPHVLTDIPEECILDHAKSSSLSKALLIVQVVGFCTNCASRLIQRLPLSLLEISTAAHALCTLLTYFVWWSKPLNVAIPTVLRGKEAREVHALLMCSKEEYNEALKMARRMAASVSLTPRECRKKKLILAANALQTLLPNPEEPPKDFKRYPSEVAPGSQEMYSCARPASLLYQAIIFAISPVFYGLIHFLGLNERFPTPLESLLWRVASVVLTCSGFFAILMTIVWFTHTGLVKWSNSDEKRNRYFGPFIRIITYMIGCIGVMTPVAHILASGFLLVESFRQLFFLEPAAYQTPSWSYYWPHLS